MFYLPVNSFEDKRQMLCCFAKKNALIDGGGRVVMSIVCFFSYFFLSTNFFDVLLPCILLPALSRPDKGEAVVLFDKKRPINLIWKVLLLIFFLSRTKTFLQTWLRAREQVNEMEKVFYHLVSLIKQDIKKFSCIWFSPQPFIAFKKIKVFFIINFGFCKAGFRFNSITEVTQKVSSCQLR